jgi:hypothetical protein
MVTSGFLRLHVSKTTFSCTQSLKPYDVLEQITGNKVDGKAITL